MFLLLCIAAALISGWVTFGLIQRFSKTLLDVPNDRSSHTRPTPRGGGLGFVVAFIGVGIVGLGLGAAGFASALPLAPIKFGQIVLVLVPLAIIGIADDYRDVSAKVRYLVQLGTALLAIASFGTLPQPWLPTSGITGGVMILLSVIGFTAIVNFYNFMDGLDGLVASVTAVQLGFLALYLQQPIWGLLVAALLGFLWWNWSPAKIFMGDVGSTVLGASVAIALLMPTADPRQNVAALAITLPLTADAIYTLIRRLQRGENIFQAHRTHLYQRLQQAGWSHAAVAIAYGLWTLVTAVLIGALAGWGSGLSLGLSILIIAGGEYWLQRDRASLEQG